MFCRKFYSEHVSNFLHDDVIIVTSSLHRKQEIWANAHETLESRFSSSAENLGVHAKL